MATHSPRYTAVSFELEQAVIRGYKTLIVENVHYAHQGYISKVTPNVEFGTYTTPRAAVRPTITPSVRGDQSEVVSRAMWKVMDNTAVHRPWGCNVTCTALAMSGTLGCGQELY
jgi:hypothetical protein